METIGLYPTMQYQIRAIREDVRELQKTMGQLVERPPDVDNLQEDEQVKGLLTPPTYNGLRLAVQYHATLAHLLEQHPRINARLILSADGMETQVLTLVVVRSFRDKEWLVLDDLPY